MISSLFFLPLSIGASFWVMPATISGLRPRALTGQTEMQRMQAKNGFEYCGIIYLEDGAERIAFEKLVEL